MGLLLGPILADHRRHGLFDEAAEGFVGIGIFEVGGFFLFPVFFFTAAPATGAEGVIGSEVADGLSGGSELVPTLSGGRHDGLGDVAVGVGVVGVAVARLLNLVLELVLVLVLKLVLNLALSRLDGLSGLL